MATYRSPSVFKYGYAEARKAAKTPEYRELRKKLEAKGLKGRLVDLDKLPPLQEPPKNSGNVEDNSPEIEPQRPLI